MKQGEKNMSSGSVGPYQQWNQLIPVWGRRVPSLRACAQRERERERKEGTWEAWESSSNLERDRRYRRSVASTCLWSANRPNFLSEVFIADIPTETASSSQGQSSGARTHRCTRTEKPYLLLGYTEDIDVIPSYSQSGDRVSPQSFSVVDGAGDAGEREILRENRTGGRRRRRWRICCWSK